MRVIGRSRIWAGEHTIFADGVAEKMVGQEADAGKIISAKKVSPDTIELEIEMDLPGEFLKNTSAKGIG